ncbi:MAG: hypothetical protein CMD96_06095 [Gammaproteobacteria bacterium]|nr:hypothetical protein [Gammaproteobacteria bacterium]HJP19132.1 transposase [Nitrospinota bacterium]|tara:strand:- start:427 stop:717 length:291 start_codon:yes stop_codon:yes gene_type:complete
MAFTTSPPLVKGSSLLLTHKHRDDIFVLLQDHLEYNTGAWYHVINRGRRGENVFSTKEDYIAFEKVLKEAVSIWNINITAYCLMPNHYHILLQTPE